METEQLLFVVDTDIPHREMMVGWLQDQGYRVMVFDNGELCLNMLDENPGAICFGHKYAGIIGFGNSQTHSSCQ